MACLVGACPTAKLSPAPPPIAWNVTSWVPNSDHNSLWPVVANGFAMPDGNRPEVKNRIAWFQKHPDYIHELTRNAQPYLYYIQQQVRARDLPSELALVPMVESNYYAKDYSHKGASGLWQMMADTASGFGVHTNYWYDGRRDVIASTRAALNYLSYLHDYFGDWLLALAAYDAGEGTVMRAIERNRALGKPTDFWSLKLPIETEVYIPKVLALAAIIRDPDRYHVHLDPVANEQYFAAVDMNKPVNVATVAKVTHSSVKEICKLNPGFRRNSMQQRSVYSLLVPAKEAQHFISMLDNNTIKEKSTPKPLTKSHAVYVADNSSTPVYYRVKRGDNLYDVAKRHHISLSAIKEANHMHNNVISIGKRLVIPTVKTA